MKSNDAVIRDITDENLDASLVIIRAAFATVAKEFSLTPENCPTHAAFITMDKLELLKDTGSRFFGLFVSNRQIGFVAVESPDNSTYYIEKVAVLPEYRHRGYGEKLVNFVIDYVKKQRGKILSLGMIDEHTVLKNWYKTLGFREKETKKFEFLPFTVCFMDYKITQQEF